MVAVAKLSISVPGDLAKAVRKRVGTRGLSGFVTKALRHELEREQLGAYLAKMDAELGEVPETTLASTTAGPPSDSSRFGAPPVGGCSARTDASNDRRAAS